MLITLLVVQIVVSLASIAFNVIALLMPNFDSYNIPVYNLFSRVAIGLAIMFFVVSVGLMFFKLEKTAHIYFLIILIVFSVVTISVPFLARYYIDFRNDKVRTAGHIKFVEDYAMKYEANFNLIRQAKLKNEKLTAEETLNLIEWAIDSNYEYLGEADKTSETMSMVRQAFEEKVIDPEAGLRGTNYRDIESPMVYAYRVYVRNMMKYSDQPEINNTLVVLKMYVEFGVDTKHKDSHGRTILDYIKTLEELL